MQITEMSIKDYEDVIALWRGTEGVGLSDADSRENVEEYLKRSPGLSLVARLDGQIVGAVLCGHDGRRGYLHHLAVAPAHRRQGIGKALVDAALSRLRDLGIQKCHLFIFAGNAQAREFWRKIGWADRSDIRVMSKRLLEDAKEFA